MGCRMSFNVHFLHFHLDFFPPNLGAVRDDEHGERFLQDIPTMKKRYAGKSSQGMLVGYWNLIEEVSIVKYKRMICRKRR